MARIRKFVAYRKLERPYTRTSKYKKKNFIKASPSIHIVKYDMGDPSKTYPFKLHLVTKSNLQIRHNALESARQTSLKLLEDTLGKTGFHLKLRKFPHHVMRENPLAAGAGADRMSTGMAHSFGKPIGNAAQFKKGDVVFTLAINKDHLDLAKRALKRASYKLPCSCFINVEEAK